MRVVVDLDLCQSHAVCESEAPDVFEVPKKGKVMLLQTEVTDDQVPFVREAIKHCPTHALSIEED
jgi:ferredoxin